jgi:putative transcriptional regulator
MTEDEINAAAMSDPDARPMTEEDLRTARRVFPLRSIRRKFNLSQEQFADEFCIPVGTIRDWEQGRSYPDAAARGYLLLIESHPEVVRADIKKRSDEQKAQLQKSGREHPRMGASR